MMPFGLSIGSINAIFLDFLSIVSSPIDWLIAPSKPFPPEICPAAFVDGTAKLLVS